jgi:phosphoserine aminotransferase
VDPDTIVIPRKMLPSDGRFGSGPSKIRSDAVEALWRSGATYLGTSHRHARVAEMIERLRLGLRTLFALPDDYEVVVGNGGATYLWDAMVFGLIERRSQHLVFGEFSARFAESVALAAHLLEPEVIRSEPGTHPTAQPSAEVDLYALTHNETSTGVAMPVARVAPEGLVAVDATSAAGGIPVDAADFDFYYFSPQKCFGSDGGLWVALCSPAAVARIEQVGDWDRYIPPSLDLLLALESSRSNQTYNTPALATLFLLVDQIEWILANGGLRWAVERCARSAAALYDWADSHEVAAPFVKDKRQRSPVVGTIDLAAAVDAPSVTRALRANGIVDTEPYRKLGRNQLRVGLYPAVEPADVTLLTACIDYVIESLLS